MKTYEWAVEATLRTSPNARTTPVKLWGEIEIHTQEHGKILGKLTSQIAKEFKALPYLESMVISIVSKESDGKVVAP